MRRVREELTSIVDAPDEAGVLANVDPETWLLALNDLRLALAVRLDISADSFETFELLPDENPQKSIYAVYFWLGWLQENLLALLN